MIWLFWTLTALLVLDALRLRGRATRLAVLPPAPPDASAAQGGYVVVTAPGVSLPPELAAAGFAHAHREGLEVLELLPGGLGALPRLGLLQLLDPARYRLDRFAEGRTGFHALVVTAALLERAGGAAGVDAEGLLGYIALSKKLKRYACRTTDLAIAPGLSARPDAPAQRMAVLSAAFGGGVTLVALATLPILLGLVAWGVATDLGAGLSLLLAYHLQPLIALWGIGPSAPDLARVTALRPLLELRDWGLGLLKRAPMPPAEDKIEVRRERYRARLAGGLDPFFEPRRTTCPLCSHDGLIPHLEVPDLFQHKPGRFGLDRCGRCRHIFQNPRLSLEGLNFYYADFYDGLGEAGLEGVFGWSDEPYLARAKMLEGHAIPRTWLDVGGGHGHFCCAARDVWPETRFDGLDLSESIDEAARRGWVDAGYRGLFPDVAAAHAGRYDVVSMSHYLEHTRDPRAELRAAHTVLCDGGHLLIEVPDPDCVTGRLLGRHWLPWFQPQHQHFVSVANLERLFGELGFEAVTWHRGEAHQTVDLFFALMIGLGRLSPKPWLPWKPRPSLLQRLWHRTVWLCGTPIMLAGWGLDHLLGPLMRRAGRSNTYRVLARKRPSAAGGSLGSSDARPAPGGAATDGPAEPR